MTADISNLRARRKTEIAVERNAAAPRFSIILNYTPNSKSFNFFLAWGGIVHMIRFRLLDR